MSRFQASPESPFHISVGAVLFNDRSEIACHHFPAGGWVGFGVIEPIYILMRESLEDNESLEQAITRGLAEEFGASGEIMNYLGTITSSFPSSQPPHMPVTKTTLYCLVRMKTFDPAKRESDDPESNSLIEWHQPAFLMKKMIAQGRTTGRSDLDESLIVERAAALIL